MSADARQPGQHVTSHPHLVLCHSSRCAIVIARASARGLVAAASAEVRAGRSPWHCRTLCRLCRSRGNHNDGLRVQPWWSANNQHALYLCRHPGVRAALFARPASIDREVCWLDARGAVRLARHCLASATRIRGVTVRVVASRVTDRHSTGNPGPRRKTRRSERRPLDLLFSRAPS